MHVLLACMSVHPMMPGARGGPERALAPLGLEFEMVVSYHADAGN